MQKTILYRDCLPAAAAAPGGSGDPAASGAKSARKVVEENAAVVFARKGCCMCHVIKLLLHGHGVNPTILQVDEQREGELAEELTKITGDSAPVLRFPAVFFGGKLFGGLEEIMAAHISGELVPRLREARALWL
ncbi:glutaredoxin-C9-like [Andrographis paniculata]|uniref:glutaredoxin-C9-like n=1 Tax=Andrographis paniculata TaxID=175694 RepID=UPI0021E718E4|nr:glutaredoxin-C9-like [Andrographis paniculata]